MCSFPKEMRLPVVPCLLLVWVAGDKLSKEENEHRLNNCGKRITDKILNARYDVENAVKSPWTVSVTVQMENNNIFCSGTLISPRHVLTASHCFAAPKDELEGKIPKGQLGGIFFFTQLVLNGRELQCMNGHTDYSVDSSLAKVVGVRNGFHILDRDPPTVRASAIWLLSVCREPVKWDQFVDIALIELERDVELGPQLNMACVSNSLEDTSSGSQLDFYGYGKNINLPKKMRTQKINRYLGYELTEVQDPNDYQRFSSEGGVTVFVARSVSRTSMTSHGDSGGGATREINGRTTVAGVISNGPQDDVPGGYEVFMTVSAQSDKICDYTGVCTPKKPKSAAALNLHVAIGIFIWMYLIQ